MSGSTGFRLYIVIKIKVLVFLLFFVCLFVSLFSFFQTSFVVRADCELIK